MRFIPRTVMLGFVNALAILIFMAQVPHILLSDETAAIRDSQLALNIAFIIVGLTIIYGLPRLGGIGKAIPSPLVAIVVIATGAITMNWKTPDVGDMGELPDTLPFFALPDVPFTLETLSIDPPVRAHADVRRSARIAAHRATARRHDRHRFGQEPRVARPGHRQHRHRLPRRHGRLRHDRSVDDQPQVRWPHPPVDTRFGRVPAHPDPRPRWPGRPDPDGSARRRDDHGLDRHVQLEEHRARHPQEDADDRNGRDGRRPSPSWSSRTTWRTASLPASCCRRSSSSATSRTSSTSPASSTRTTTSGSTPSPASCSSHRRTTSSMPSTTTP